MILDAPDLPAPLPSPYPPLTAALPSAPSAEASAELWLGCEALHPLTWLPSSEAPVAGKSRLASLIW